MREFKIIDVDLIEANPYQPRIQFNEEALMELAQSIRENGLIQPITVREVDGKYQIVAGERRYRALCLNGATEVPVQIYDANELQMAELALIENIQRENLSAIEEAKSYLQIMKYANINQSQLALRVGKSQSAVANKIRLLKLDEEVQEAVNQHEITERHARALLNEDTQTQKELLQEIKKKGLNVAQTEKLVKKSANKPKKKIVVKGISKSAKIAINTIHQAVQMIKKTGIQVEMDEFEQEEDVLITIRIPK